MTSELLQNPAVQAAVLPSLVALAVATLLRRSFLLGLAVAAGFACAVTLSIGLSFEGLSSLRKLAIAGMLSLTVLPMLARTGVHSTLATRVGIVSWACISVLWMLLRILAQRGTIAAAGAAFAACVFMALLVEFTSAAGRADSIRGTAAAMVLAAGSGLLAILGASATLGVLGIAAAAGVAATGLIQILTNQHCIPVASIAAPAAIVSASVVLLTVFTGELSWYCPIPLLAAPWAVRWIAPTSRRGVVVAVLAVLAAAVPVALAIALAWFSTPSIAKQS